MAPRRANWELTKWASSFYNNYKELTWGVNFGANQTTGDKLGKTFDGSRQTIVFTDTLGAGMTFNQADATRTVLNLRPADGKSIPVTNAAGQDATTQYGDFDVKATYSQDGRTATYEVTGPFQNGTNFTLEYPVSFVDANGNAVAASRGTSYENTVNLKGTDLTSTQQQSYVQYFDISVQMEPGFGGFDVTKVVEGEAAAQAAGSSSSSTSPTSCRPQPAPTRTGRLPRARRPPERAAPEPPPSRSSRVSRSPSTAPSPWAPRSRSPRTPPRLSPPPPASAGASRSSPWTVRRPIPSPSATRSSSRSP